MNYYPTIECAFAYYTECALATVEGLEMRKRTPKHELARARSIADGMVAQCRITIPQLHAAGRCYALARKPRLARLMDADAP
jgi:hypothetical protein